MPAAEIPERVGQAVEALETVRLLAEGIERAGLQAPVVSALAHLIEGTLPLEEWVKMVRASSPSRPAFGRRLRGRPGWWERFTTWLRGRFARR